MNEGMKSIVKSFQVKAAGALNSGVISNVSNGHFMELEMKNILAPCKKVLFPWFLTTHG